MTRFVSPSRAALELLVPQRWMLLSGCRRFDFLPWTGDSDSADEIAERQMREVCRRCPVRHHCEDLASSPAIVAGFWAGRWRDVKNTRTAPGRVA